MTAEQNQEIKIAVLEAKVDHLIGHVKELTLRVRANEKVVASISLLGVIACTFIGAGYFAPKAEACSPRLDGEPTYCPPWDEVLVKEPEGITEESFDEEFPDAFTHTVTLHDTRDDDPFDIAHMGHDFPTDEWIEKLRDHESRQTRTQPDDAINKALEDMEFEYGSDDTTLTEELLQLPSDRDQPSFRW